MLLYEKLLIYLTRSLFEPRFSLKNSIVQLKKANDVFKYFLYFLKNVWQILALQYFRKVWNV